MDFMKASGAFKSAGTASVAGRTGAIVTNGLTRGAHAFIGQQGMFVASSLGSDGHRWSSLLFGKRGFVRAMNSRVISIWVPAHGTRRGGPVLVQYRPGRTHRPAVYRIENTAPLSGQRACAPTGR